MKAVILDTETGKQAISEGIRSLKNIVDAMIENKTDNIEFVLIDKSSRRITVEVKIPDVT